MIDRIKYRIVKEYIQEPIFLIVFARSGSTALFRALKEHSKILSGRKEAPILEYVGGMVNGFYNNDIKLSAKAYRKNTIPFDDYTTKRKMRLFAHEFSTSDNYLKKLRAIRKKKWLVGTFLNREQTRGILELFPKAKFIFLHRNGIEQVNSSLKFFNHLQDDFMEACDAWNHTANVFKHFLTENNCIPIRHDQLVSKPEEVLKKIFQFLDMEFESQCLEYIQYNILHPEGNTDSKGDYKEFVQRRSATVWTEEQEAYFVEKCAENMKLFGYSLEFER